MDDVRRERPEENPYVGTFQRAYPHSEEDLARVREAEQEVMRGMVNDTWPGTADDDMSEAMSRIDTSDHTIGARIMATAFAQRSNTYFCRGMGDAGKGILKTMPGFQRKGAAGASSSNSRLQDQFESLQSELEAQRARESELEAQRAREMAESYAASMAAHTTRRKALADEKKKPGRRIFFSSAKVGFSRRNCPSSAN
ncbi:hypothetical protein ACLB2K_065434 [Fragaria x ananassa]